MSTHCGYVIKVTDLRPHPNADRLQLLHVFETDTCVSLDVKIGDIGVYFPADLQLSEKFCAVNDLIRRKDENGNPAGGFLEPNRHVRAIRLRGERSDGIYLPITCLMEFAKISDFKPGDTIDTVNGEEICRKFIPVLKNPPHSGEHVKKAKAKTCDVFFEHIDTEQLAYNLGKFHNGDEVQLTIKMHGTSQRTGNLPLHVPNKQNFLQKLLRRPVTYHDEYGIISGTRRVVMEQGRSGGYYTSDEFRYAMEAKLRGKLPKNFCVYYEVVGYQGHGGQPIMGQTNNKKISDPQFVKQYGPVTTFSYGCDPSHDFNDEIPCCEMYVYRITMVNEDGEVIELSPDQIHYYCTQWGVHCVPEVARFIIPPDVNPGEYVVRECEKYYDGPDPIGKTHVREGVVARIMNRNKFEVYKHKNMSFKILEGIAKDTATAPDMEEAQELE